MSDLSAISLVAAIVRGALVRLPSASDEIILGSLLESRNSSVYKGNPPAKADKVLASARRDVDQLFQILKRKL